MVFQCQRDSYLKQFSTTVLSCTPSHISLVTNGKKNEVSCYQVILEDTILFPEGGGQPDDRGKIGSIDVFKVERKGAVAIHYTLSEVPAGSKIDVTLDWDRRFDHMQQHTAQHLITAVADSLFSFKTTSWNLGELLSTIELDTPLMSQEQLDSIEQVVNEKIRACIRVVPHLYADKEDPALKQFRARGLPSDHEGPVRVLEIDGIDATLCCGTHVSNLAQLQVIKILGSEKGKKNKCNLTFVSGNRLIKYLNQCHQVGRELTGILKGPLEKHCELADKAVKGWKSSQKINQSLLKDLAVLEAEKYCQNPHKDAAYFHFRKDGDADYMSILVSNIQKCHPETLCLVCVGDDKEEGLFTVAGPILLVDVIGPRIAQVFDGKGAMTSGRYRGKANKMVQRSKAEKLIREYALEVKKVSDSIDIRKQDSL